MDTTSSPRVVINVRDHGALGDGRADDRSAIQGALDAVPAQGAVVRFPGGVYLVGGKGDDRMFTLRPGTTLMGDGSDSTTLRVAAGSGSWSAFMEYAEPSTDPGSLAVSGLTFDMNTRENPVVVSPEVSKKPRLVIRSAGGQSARISIVACTFQDCSNVNTLYLAGRLVVVRECQFTGTGAGARMGWDHSSIYAVARAGGAIAITSNTFSGVPHSGASRTAIETHGGSQVVQGNVIAGYLKGMNITGIADNPTDNVLVASNEVSQALIAIHLWAAPYASAPAGALRNVIVRGNRADIRADLWTNVAGATGTYACGLLLDAQDDSAMSGIVLQSNTIRWSGPPASTFQSLDDRACGVTFKSGGVVSGLDVLDNSFYGPPSAGVMLDGKVAGCLVRGNTFTDPGRLSSLAGDPSLASGVVLGGTLDGITITDNVVADTRLPHVVRQAVASHGVMELSGLEIRANTVSCADNSSVPELDDATRSLM